MKTTVVINGTPHIVEGEQLSYQTIVDLADTSWGKQALHSVLYHHRVPFEQLPGERDGLLAPGQSVKPSSGMSISAMVTGDS